MIKPHRKHPLWTAYILHRVSGLGLGLFLPTHFYVLGLALSGPSALNGALAWTNHTFFKLSEFGLVFLLAVHMFGGLRLLALELLPWNPRQKSLAAVAVGVSFFFAVGFLIRAFQ